MKDSERILGAKREFRLLPRGQTFILQFLTTPSTRGEPVLDERRIFAGDVEDAAREAALISWPPGARSSRLIDLDGQEVFQRHRLDGR